MRNSDTRDGLTRIDVLAIVVCTALLLQLALPLLRSSRESTRSIHCQRNLKQLANGMLKYHDANGKLPPAAVWKTDGVEYDEELLSLDGQLKFIRMSRPIEFTRQAWTHFVLPYIGGEFDAFNHTVPITDPQNAVGRTQQIPTMSCPSDIHRYSQFVLQTGSREARFARGNYAINGGSHNIYEQPGWLTNPRSEGVVFTSDRDAGTFAFWGSGVAGINKQFRLDDFANGTGNLVLLEEVRAGVSEIDPRGVWSLGQIGSSITWGHGANGDAYLPNSRVKDSDDIRGCIELHRTLGADFLAHERMPCCDHCTDNNQAAARSQHPKGVNVAMTDGSVRFIGNDVDVGLWHVLHSRFTPSSVFADDRLFKYRAKSARRAETVNSTFRNSIGMEFVRLPAGEFTMGLPNVGNHSPFPEEAPPHKVRITSAFLLGVHEITQKQFADVMAIKSSSDIYNLSLPVVNVTWFEANEFCKRLSALPAEVQANHSYRLPTEAEWEYSARAGQNEPYPFNSEWDGSEYLQTGVVAGKNWRQSLQVLPIGSYPPNALGIHDMCGNVFEWTNDWFSLDYYQRSPVNDPAGPESGYLKVVRGWYWLYTGPACVANPTTTPWQKSPFIGFRVVCENTASD